MQRTKSQNLLVLGAGNFGTCLAQHLALQGHEVLLWDREDVVVEGINGQHRNPKYLSSIDLPPSLRATLELSPERIAAADGIVLAIPTQYMRKALPQLQAGIRSSQLLVCAAKGIELGTEKLPTHIVADVLGEEIAEKMVALSGPSFAIEVAQRQPTCVTVASTDLERAKWAQQVFHAPEFRAYTSEDPIGLEIAGALKNVIAIGSGACTGLGFQANSRAALITRGLAEMTRIGVALGANPLTFKGLGGVGDLFLTCTSEKSRNFTVGYRLGQGEELEAVLASIGSVAEGVSTTQSAYKLAKRLGVSAPITTAIYRVLYEKQPISKVVQELMNRDAGPELS